MRKHWSPGEVLIFRRYRRDRWGKVLDARKYGFKAWPIRLPANGRKS
jgi:hypothetical protein